MKISLAQINVQIGDFQANKNKIVDGILAAKKDGADLVCFPELSICGYPPRDFLEFSDFIRKSMQVVEDLRPYSHALAIIVGGPRKNPTLEGKDLFNSAFFIADGEVKYIADKALLPTYDVFDEYRYFEPADTFDIIEYKDKKIALTVCEDIWNVPEREAETGVENPLYRIIPLDLLRSKNPDFIINISASPFTYKQAIERRKIVQVNAVRYGLPLFYVNCVGAQTELIFDGGSLVCNSNGIICDEMPFFESCQKTYELDSLKDIDADQLQKNDKIDLIHRALLMGIKDYFGKLGFTRAIVGLSGGIDSAVTTALAAQALGSENVRVLLMPSQFSSDHSVADARQLCENMHIQYDVITIKAIYDQVNNSLSPLFEGQEFDVTEENIQARIRGMLLMAVSNKFGNILLNTSNKSELAVGYGTLYGDLAGGLSILGDVYKTEVFELARAINAEEELIPINSIVKPPSAELRPNQKDSDSLPDYDELDAVLQLYIEGRKGPQEIIAMGYEEALVLRILKLVNRNEFKRHQTAPVLRVSPKAFGMGRRMPIVAKYLS